METLFDHNPTQAEIEEGGFLWEWQRIRHGIDFTLPITEQSYKEEITEEAAIFDIALLFEIRKQKRVAKRYWERIPDKAEQYRFGFDNKVIPNSTPHNPGTQIPPDQSS